MRKYTEKQKVAYYKKRALAAERSHVRGRGGYKLGRSYVRGRGGYSIAPGIKGALKADKIGEILGGASGAILGSMTPGGPAAGLVGGALGRQLGGAAGRLFKHITGWGEYTVKENSLLFPDRIVPSFGEDSIRVRKREYICDINASTSFSNNVFSINPGLVSVFPWLSAIAQNYEQYRFNGLLFQFVSTSSDAIASTTDLGLGQVILASDYNAADPAFVNAPQMLSSMFSNSGKPSENILHAIECAPTDQAQKLYYVRSGDPPSGTDVRLYDICTFQLATQNMPAVYSGMGQLWVSYDITFCKSVQNNQLGFDISTDKYQMSGVNAANPLGTSHTLAEHSDLGSTIVGRDLIFPPSLASGYYQVTYNAVGTSDPVLQPTTTGTNCTKIAAWANNTDTEASDTGNTANSLVYSIIWRIDDRDAKINFGTDGLVPVSVTSCDLLITQVNGEIFI